MNLKVIKKNDELQIFSNGSQIKSGDVDVVWNDMKFDSPKNPQRLPQNRLLDIMDMEDTDDSIVDLLLITSTGEILSNGNSQTMIVPRLFINDIEQKISNIKWYIDNTEVNSDSLFLVVNKDAEWDNDDEDGDNGNDEPVVDPDDEIFVLNTDNNLTTAQDESQENRKTGRLFNNDGDMVEVEVVTTINDQHYNSSIIIQRIDNYDEPVLPSTGDGVDRDAGNGGSEPNGTTGSGEGEDTIDDGGGIPIR